MPQLPLAVEFEHSANAIAGESELIVSLKVNYTELDLLEGTQYDLNFENLDLNITFPAEKRDLNHLMLQVVL
ncbi:MAG: hypothetical protein AB8U82_00815 [Rickettsia endosymbiont of Haemaphysalis japonica]